MASPYSNFVSSIIALFSVSTAAPPAAESPTATLEQIRSSMLELLLSCPPEASASLQRRIRFAVDVQALWFLRSELMALLARSCGEVQAREKVTALSPGFHQLLPAGMRSRTSFLDSGGHSQWDEHLGR